MEAPKLEIVAPDPKKHFEAVCDLCSKVFSTPSYYDRYAKWKKFYFDGGHYDWRAARIGLCDGQVVTHVGVWDYQMRIGSATVRSGGVGAVSTDGRYRKHGFMKLTMSAIKEGMRAEGYDMSWLGGIRNFYYRFGYQVAWPTTTYILPVVELPTEKPELRPHKFQVRHREDIAAIYNKEWAGVTGSAVRPTYLKSYNPFNLLGLLWRDGKGRTVGYLTYKINSRRMEVANFGGELDQVLRVIGLVARRLGLEDVGFNTLPYLSPMARRLRRMNCKVESQFAANAGPLIATVNLTTTLSKITGTLSARLAASPLVNWKGDLLVSDLRDRVLLKIRRGEVKAEAAPREWKADHALEGNDHVASLLIGADEPLELVRVGEMKLKGEAVKLIPILFPNEHPMLNQCDSM